MNTSQNAVFNHLMSLSNSFLTGSSGNDVADFTAEGDLEMALREIGFKQNIKQDKFGMYYGHGCWWHSGAEVLVCNVPGSKVWQIAGEGWVLTSAELATQ